MSKNWREINSFGTFIQPQTIKNSAVAFVLASVIPERDLYAHKVKFGVCKVGLLLVSLLS